MTDPLFDDVKSLLDKDFGDDRILKQISRACENNEVISNYERNYVKKLAEKYLGRVPEATHIPVEQKSITPDIVIPQAPSVQKTQTIQPPKISYSNPKNSKIMLGIGGLALAIIVIVAISFSGISDVSPTVKPTVNPTSDSLLIQTDFSSYNKKDIISINGISDVSGSVNLSITNQNNELVWTEQVSLKSDGRYSTLAIAGGPGWENSGTYTIKVDNGQETSSGTFSFTS
ncbi:MAG: hypothetical protein HOK63_01350 [Thaumarchaeota archaeon]|jgi:hypothetical protein|nr:hypothetical protein [Nitrososphaerota archaeon]MBT5842618.1 hypothetical protein [Nitrososphaerota archaeon]MBT6468286.1 hypothetical protein [Nitrososphaerota archaeon]